VPWQSQPLYGQSVILIAGGDRHPLGHGFFLPTVLPM